MILEISEDAYQNIWCDEQMWLPVSWDGDDFSKELYLLFQRYIKRLEEIANEGQNDGVRLYVDMQEVKRECRLLIRTINHYLNGYPAKAFSTFNRAMKVLAQNPLKMYQKSVIEQFDAGRREYHDGLWLFRAVKVQDDADYGRTRVFHTPYII